MNTLNMDWVHIESTHPIAELVHFDAWSNMRDEFIFEDDGCTISKEGCIEAGYCIDQL